MEGDLEADAVPLAGRQGRHLKKRALKNKALAVSFNEKDLRDYVTGFHKRKKKRRKEAQRKQEEAERRKRNDQRKKRKLERELALYGGVLPNNDPGAEEIDENQEDREQVESIAGTKTYENVDLKVTVITSEINREEESYPSERKAAAPSEYVGSEKRHNVPVNKKKPFKKVAKHGSRSKSRRNRKMEKKRNKKVR